MRDLSACGHNWTPDGRKVCYKCKKAKNPQTDFHACNKRLKSGAYVEPDRLQRHCKVCAIRMRDEWVARTHYTRSAQTARRHRTHQRAKQAQAREERFTLLLDLICAEFTVEALEMRVTHQDLYGTGTAFHVMRARDLAISLSRRMMKWSADDLAVRFHCTPRSIRVSLGRTRTRLEHCHERQAPDEDDLNFRATYHALLAAYMDQTAVWRTRSG